MSDVLCLDDIKRVREYFHNPPKTEPRAHWVNLPYGVVEQMHRDNVNLGRERDMWRAKAMDGPNPAECAAGVAGTIHGLELRRDRLEQYCREYGRHKRTCNVNLGFAKKECSCGWDAKKEFIGGF